jgi:uncharacterized membrane protein HdeD (DUF308 family)
MANTEFLAQFLGVFSVIIGVLMLFRPRVVKSVFNEVFSSRAITYLIGMLEVIGGILIIISHSVWSSILASVVSLLGWLLLIEGIIYLTASQKLLGKVAVWFHNEKIFWVVSFSYIVLGIYLMWATFGSLPPIFTQVEAAAASFFLK